MQSTEIETIESKLKQYIAENILFSSEGYPYSEDASFLENGVIDSMNVLELVFFLEEQFGVHVEDHELIPENFDSIAQVAQFIQQKQSNA